MDSDEMLRTIARNLEYSRLDRGRHLIADLPRYGLQKNWRLEASRRLPDVRASSEGDFLDWVEKCKADPHVPFIFARGDTGTSPFGNQGRTLSIL